MSQSQSSLRSVGILTICSFLQLAVQVGIQQILAKQFGATNDMDAYTAAMKLPMVLSAIFISSLSSAFLPVYMACRLNGGKDDDEGKAFAHQFSSQLGFWIIVISTTLAMLGYFFSEQIITLLHKGFNTQQVVATAKVFRVLTWLTVTNALTSYLGALHHGEKRFRIPAFSGVIGVGVTVGLLCIESMRSTTTGVAQAVLAGSVVCILLQSKLFLGNFSLSFKSHPTMKKFLVLLTPIVIGGFCLHIGHIVDSYIASDTVGSISLMGYAWRITTAMIVLTSSFSIVHFPSLSTRRANDEMDLFVAEVAHGWRFMAVLLVPICAGLALFSEPLIRDLFQRGQFTAENSQQVGFLITLYLGVIVGSGLGTITFQTLCALGDTVTPMIIGLVLIPISIWLKFQFGNANSYGERGIVAATSFTYLVAIISHLMIVRRKIGRGMFDGLLKTLYNVIPSTALALGLSAWIVSLSIPYSALVAAPFGAGCYLLMMYLLRNEFVIRMVGYLTGQRST